MGSFIHLERVNGERSLVHRICMKYKSYVLSCRFKLNTGFPVYVRGYKQCSLSNDGPSHFATDYSENRTPCSYGCNYESCLL